MIGKETAERILCAALSNGGEFAEIFIEQTKKTTLSMVNGKVEKALAGIDYGAGIRIFDGFGAVYAYTNDLSEGNMVKTAREAAAAVKEKKQADIRTFHKRQMQTIHPIVQMPESVMKKDKVAFLSLAHGAASAYSPEITQTRCAVADTVQRVTIINSEGLWAEDERVRTRFTVEAVASSETEKQSGYFAPGGHVGFELFSRIDVEALAKDAARTAITMLHADPCPSKKMPVVIDNGFGGVIFHEACGHSLEATAVARNASVFAGRLGEQIASPLVTAVDDGTIPNAWGSEMMDDEGTLSQRNVLIENGILKSYLVDRLNGKRMGMPATGSARRESYRFAPTSRMTNTFIAPGQSTTKEIIENTEYGLYAKQMGGGSVDPATGAFNFAVLEGYMIRNGRVCEPVRGATLIGKGGEVLLKIDMVGDNLARAQGMCGSISGSIPTDVGQPMLRVSEITVGGRG